jgi:hypothetical protein
MVQAWYQGGISVFDFTDSAKPVEIAYFDRGPIDEKQLITGGHWSAYWYNGNIYATEIARGLDVLRLKPSEYLSQSELDAARLAYTDEFNPQHQRRLSWPATTVVARAYVDQLTRAGSIDAARAAELRSTLDQVDHLRGRPGRDEKAASRLESLAAQTEAIAASSDARDAARARALAATLRMLKSRD